jgi:tungstate transport system substrate-binding protein
MRTRLRRSTLSLLFVAGGTLLTACSADRAATPDASARAPLAASARAPASPRQRSGDRTELLLATTTSTQDSGLLDVLVPLFEQQSGYRVKTIAVGSGAALDLGQRGAADVVLAHAPQDELAFVASGAGVNRQLVMYNDFILVGPPGDPASLAGQPDVIAALQALASMEAPFVSRADNSGTHQLEQTLWTAAAVTPQGQSWYIESGSGMGQTLQIAEQRGAYTLSDRATYLAFQDRIDAGIAVAGDARLRNPYHVIAVNDQQFPQVNRAAAAALIDFLLSAPVQAQIGSFGQDTYGQSLFTPCARNRCGLANPDG